MYPDYASRQSLKDIITTEINFSPLAQQASVVVLAPDAVAEIPKSVQETAPTPVLGALRNPSESRTARPTRAPVRPNYSESIPCFDALISGVPTELHDAARLGDADRIQQLLELRPEWCSQVFHAKTPLGHALKAASIASEETEFAYLTVSRLSRFYCRNGHTLADIVRDELRHGISAGYFPAFLLVIIDNMLQFWVTENESAQAAAANIVNTSKPHQIIDALQQWVTQSICGVEPRDSRFFKRPKLSEYLPLVCQIHSLSAQLALLHIAEHFATEEYPAPPLNQHLLRTGAAAKICESLQEWLVPLVNSDNDKILPLLKLLGDLQRALLSTGNRERDERERDADAADIVAEYIESIYLLF